MGGRVQKIAFIIFALLFVAIMAVLNTSVLNMATSANKTLTTTVSTSDSSSLEVYNDAEVYGSTVSDCAKKPDGIISSQLHIFVRTAGATAYKEYFGKETYSLSDSGNPDYINPNTMFKSNLITNANEVTVGILFYQKDAEDAAPQSNDFSSIGTPVWTTQSQEASINGEGWRIVGTFSGT